MEVNCLATSHSDDLRADVEFREILCAIKRLVLNVNCPRSLALCRRWLEKLSADAGDKSTRNRYLIELAKQIKENKLSPPFDQEPRPGDLRSFPEDYYEAIEDNGDYIYHSNQEESEKKFSDDSNTSWCDLTDDSSTSIIRSTGAGDAKIKYLQRKPIMDGFNTDDFGRNNDREDKKQPLKETNFIPADWKVTIESLQLRLTETLSQNNDFKNLIANLNANLAYEKELRLQLETKTNVQKGSDYDELKARFEQSLHQIQLKSDSELAEKRSEIARLNGVIRSQCETMSSEIASLKAEIERFLGARSDGDKMAVLKKCLSKMDGLFRKSEVAYAKKIAALEREMELKERFHRMQIVTQRAEILARSSVDHQKQVDQVLDNLEVKYVKMMEFHEQQASEAKRSDEQRIEYLCDLLRSHNVPYDVL